MKNVLMQNNTLSYTDRVAISLIHFSEKNPSFLSWFLGAIPDSFTPENGAEENFFPTTFLNIPYEDVAVRKALWLLDTLTSTQSTEAKKTQAILSAWKNTKTQDEYSFVVLGLKYGILNYGIIGYPKLRCEPLDVVIRKDVATTTPVGTLVQQSLKLGMGIIEQGLVVAQGVAGKLEPELHDWFFGDKKVVLHTCSKTTISNLAQELHELGVFTAHSTDEQGISLLAISPVIYSNDLQYSNELKPFGQ